MPSRLGAPNFCVGVVAGNRSINWINSLFIPGPDDGKVSVERTMLAGEADHIVIHATHPWMMRNREVIRQTIEFLRKERFDRSNLLQGWRTRHSTQSAPPRLGFDAPDFRA